MGVLVNFYGQKSEPVRNWFRTTYAGGAHMTVGGTEAAPKLATGDNLVALKLKLV